MFLPLLDSTMFGAEAKFWFPLSLIDVRNKSSSAFSKFCLLPPQTAVRCGSHCEKQKEKSHMLRRMSQGLMPWTLVMFGANVAALDWFPWDTFFTWIKQFFYLLSHCSRFFRFLLLNAILTIIHTFHDFYIADVYGLLQIFLQFVVCPLICFWFFKIHMVLCLCLKGPIFLLFIQSKNWKI